MKDENLTNFVQLERKTPQETIEYLQSKLLKTQVDLRMSVAQYNACENDDECEEYYDDGEE